MVNIKKFFKFTSLFGVMLFSFFYTEKIANLMQSKSPIMQSINELEDKYDTLSVDAIIEGDYIIPGIMGRKLNKTKSYVNMSTATNIFNEYYLIFDDLSPSISTSNNKDKIIKKGNDSNINIAILLDMEISNEIREYLINNNIKASILIDENTYNKSTSLEQINNDIDNYKVVESLLNKNNLNTNICYVKVIGKNNCMKYDKYMIEETISLNTNNLTSVINSLDNAIIIKVNKGVNVTSLKKLIQEIELKGYKLDYVSNVISEKINKLN